MTSLAPHHDHALLLAVAAPREAEAVCAAFGASVPNASWRAVAISSGVELVITGVGKANAAGAVARVVDVERHTGVVSLGVAGWLGGHKPGGAHDDVQHIGAVVRATRCVPADEGVRTPDGFLSCADIGFPLAVKGDHIDPSPDWPSLRGIDALIDAPVATVSACSGSEAAASDTARRAGAAVEAMEGWAVGLVVRRLAPTMPFGEVRVVSNTTGDRANQVWKLDAALAVLTRVSAAIANTPEVRT